MTETTETEIDFEKFKIKFDKGNYVLTKEGEAQTPDTIDNVLNNLASIGMQLVVPKSLNFMSNLYSDRNNPHFITTDDHVAKIILLYLIHFDEKADIPSPADNPPAYFTDLLDATNALKLSGGDEFVDGLGNQSSTEINNQIKNESTKDDIKKTNDMLTTLLSKIDNKQQIYGSLRYFSWLWLILFFICVLVLIGINVHTSETLKVFKFPLMLGISLSICVLVIINMMFFKKNTYEHYTNEHFYRLEDFYGLVTSNQENHIITHKVESHVRDVLFTYDLLVKNQNSSKDDTSKILTNILQDVNNKKYIYVRQYQSLDYKTNEIKLQIKYMKYGLLMTGVIGALFAFETQGYINKSLAYFITFISLLLYCLVILLIIKNNKYRNKYNWNKIYWNIGDIKGVCQGPESDNCVLKEN